MHLSDIQLSDSGQYQAIKTSQIQDQNCVTSRYLVHSVSTPTSIYPPYKSQQYFVQWHSVCAGSSVPIPKVKGQIMIMLLTLQKPHPLTNIPTTYQHPTPYGFWDMAQIFEVKVTMVRSKVKSRSLDLWGCITTSHSQCPYKYQHPTPNSLWDRALTRYSCHPNNQPPQQPTIWSTNWLPAQPDAMGENNNPKPFQAVG